MFDGGLLDGGRKDGRLFPRSFRYLLFPCIRCTCNSLPLCTILLSTLARLACRGLAPRLFCLVGLNLLGSFTFNSCNSCVRRAHAPCGLRRNLPLRALRFGLLIRPFL